MEPEVNPVDNPVEQQIVQDAQQPPNLSSESDTPVNVVLPDVIPEVTRYKVLFGKSKKPLFFLAENGRCYDCASESWMDEKPPVADELESRPITVADFFHAILHGLVDENAYNILQSKNMVTDQSKALYEKLGKLKELHGQLSSQLQKSEEVIDEQSSDENSFPDDYFDDMDQTEDESDEDGMQDMSMQQETDVVAEIFRLAHQYGIEPKLEQLIRSIVQDELSKSSQSGEEQEHQAFLESLDGE